MQIPWLWLAVGFLPYSIQCQKTRHEQVVYIQALFWRLSMRWRGKRCSWTLSFPWIKHQRW
jgi:hypothetical protein